MTGRETALLVEVPEADPVVGPWRARHDPVASRGVPGHITTLFPFVPPHAFDEAVLDAVGAVVHGAPAFRFALVAVDEFPGVVWLRPTPDAPFRDLTERMWAAFPAHPPYGGRHPDSQPHLTVAVVTGGEDQAELVGRIRTDVGPHLPIRADATAVSVFMTDDRGIWHRTHRLALGR